jgi:hypothetical protein
VADDDERHPAGPMMIPTVVTDGGPWALHNMPCPICLQRRAMLNLDDGTFHPCDTCRNRGWELRQRRRRKCKEARRG